MSTRHALEIFAATLDVAPDQRAEYLSRECAGDEPMRSSVEALLAAHELSAGFLEPPTTPALPTSIGSYRLLRQLGSGGMGVVFLGERHDGAFQQQVAIKLLARRFNSAETVRRAESERQFLARLDHSNIARILDGGTIADGQPYVVMEYVDGEAIDVYARGRALDLRARIELFDQVLAAVDAAHRALIIHRDLKPGNVLVTREGQVKLLDFGIAKSLDETLGGDATHTGMHALTPQYASPEQLSGKPLTTACDVYALGLLLYELLTGHAAHATEGRSLYELEQWLTSHPPARPSTQVDASALVLPRRTAIDWKRRIDGDLDRVVMKALEAEPQRRYASAQAFADDLRRWLDDRPVLAHGGGAMYRIGKFLRRNRLPAAAAAIALIAILTGAVIALQQGWRASREAQRAHRANTFLTGIIDFGDPRASGKPVLLVDALDHAAAQIPSQLAGEPQLEGDIRHAIGEAYIGLDRTDAAKEQLARAAELRAADGGNEYAATLDVQAMLLWRLGDTRQAEALLRRALAACTHDTAGLIQRASVLGDFAGLLGDLDRFAEALPMAEESTRLSSSLPEIPAANRAASWNNLATSYYGLGRLEEAREAFSKAAALFESIEPPPELDLSINYNNQAVLLHRLGRLAEALPMAERSVVLKRKVMGPDYPQLVRPLSHLAEFNSEAGRHEEAASAIREALRLAPALYPADDAKIGDLHALAARLALARGDSAAAAHEAETALSIYAKATDAESDRRDDAETLLKQAREALQALSPEP
jgi:serine/threonine-protein kinase